MRAVGVVVLVVALVVALVGAASCGRSIDDAANKAPVVAIDGPSTASIGAIVSFTAHATDDKSVASVTWDFGDGGTATGTTVTHAYAAAGGYVVAATAVDGEGKDGRAQAVITVGAPHPTASFSASTTAASVSSPVTFDASASTGTTPIASYAWSFGDGATAQGVTVTHAFTRVATFHVALTVTDDAGATDDTTVDVVVSPLDVTGSWSVGSTPSSYPCPGYDAAFPDATLALTVDASGAVTATGAAGRSYTGTLDGAALSLHGNIALDAGTCGGNAPVDVTLTATVDGDSWSGHATAYFDLGIGCQCSAGFTVDGARQ